MPGINAKIVAAPKIEAVLVADGAAGLPVLVANIDQGQAGGRGGIQSGYPGEANCLHEFHSIAFELVGEYRCYWRARVRAFPFVFPLNASTKFVDDIRLDNPCPVEALAIARPAVFFPPEVDLAAVTGGIRPAPDGRPTDAILFR